MVVCLQVLLLTLISSVCIELCYGATTEEAAINDYLYKKCNNIKVAEEIKEEANVFMKNLGVKLEYIPDDVKHFCEVERKILTTAVEQLMKNFKQCVIGDEEFLPAFAARSFKGFMEFLCHDYGENVKKLYGSDGQSCLANLRKNQTENHVDVCFKNIVGPSKNFITKDELCRDLDIAQECFRKVIRKECPTSEAFPTLNARLFAYLKAPCSSSTTIVANYSILLTIALLVLRQYFSQ